MSYECQVLPCSDRKQEPRTRTTLITLLFHYHYLAFLRFAVLGGRFFCRTVFAAFDLPGPSSASRSKDRGIFWLIFSRCRTVWDPMCCSARTACSIWRLASRALLRISGPMGSTGIGPLGPIAHSGPSARLPMSHCHTASQSNGILRTETKTGTLDDPIPLATTASS